MFSSHHSAEYPILPIKNSILFPAVDIPFSVGRPASVATVEEAMKNEDKILVVISQRDPKTEMPAERDLYKVGTKATVRKLVRSERGMELVLHGIERVKMVDLMQRQPFMKGKFEILPPPREDGAEFEAIHRTVLQEAKELQQLVDPEGGVPLNTLITQIEDPLTQIYVLASVLGVDLERDQQILEAETKIEAAQILHDFLSHETRVLELQRNITTKTQSKLSRQQREYLLREQLETIQKELRDIGASDSEQPEVDTLRQQIDEAGLPDKVHEEVQKEMARLGRLNPAAPDYQMTRSYIELVAELPWSKQTDDNLDLSRARRVLDEDHYDLKEVKERIIEHLAVLKLNPSAKAPILCFVGPPGVGKTSLGESMARALGREFERMSLGGLHDEAELRGHRRTYVGAMPGRILQAVRRAGVKNPLLMLDEVDKVGQDFRGDPAAALMEILDPSQNHAFRDNYLNLPFDLSKVFFVLTANALDPISRPLLDRMEVLHLTGYSDKEKLEIAKTYLIPARTNEAGLSPEQLSIPDETLLKIIHRYTREAGLRELDRTIGRLARKVAVRLAESNESLPPIQPDQLSELLGAEKFFAEQVHEDLPPGVAIGLAWTPTGGDILFVEATLLPGAKGLKLTGHLGDVMKESAQAAQSYIWNHASSLHIEQDQLVNTGVHVHVPQGAIPKDGPSAGVTIATALASAYTGLAMEKKTALTGEISLSGRILPVGGIKEKILAAHRAGLKRVIVPQDNEKDLKDLPDSVRDELEFTMVNDLKEVLLQVLPGLEQHMAAHRPAPAGASMPSGEVRH